MRSLRASDRGAAVVEFALIMPVLILLVAGVIQFGIMYSQYQVLQGAAREGARCAAVQGNGFTDCDVVDRVEAAALNYEISETPSQSVECVGEETRGDNVTVEWDQAIGTGVLGAMVPGIPDTISATISGTFRCE